jgi:hypothetical protein
MKHTPFQINSIPDPHFDPQEWGGAVCFLLSAFGSENALSF